MGWTSERIDLLRKWWLEGLSTVVIAERLGGVTKNSVIGKAHRIGLETHIKSPQHDRFKPNRMPRKNETRRYPPRPKRLDSPYTPKPTIPPKIPEVPENEPVPMMLSLVDLGKHQCKWPHGDPRDVNFGFCGHKQDFPDNPWRPYCAFHQKLGTRKDFRYGRKVR